MPCYIDPTLEVTAPFPTQELDIWLLLKPTSSPGCIWSSSWNNLVNQNLSTWMLVAKAATSFAKYRIKEYLQQNFWTWVWFPPMLKKTALLAFKGFPYHPVSRSPFPWEVVNLWAVWFFGGAHFFIQGGTYFNSGGPLFLTRKMLKIIPGGVSPPEQKRAFYQLQLEGPSELNLHS